MNLGTVVNLAIGLILTFATMALVVSGVKEALAAILQTRSKTLRQGIQNLLNDPTMSGLAGRLFEHAAVHPLGGSTPADGKAPPTPTYIAPRQFASALIEVIQNPDPASKLGLKDAIDKIEAPQIKALLSGVYDRVDGDVVRMHEEVASWFDAAMTRVSDAYKRDAQVWTFAIAFILAALLNIDTFQVARSIWSAPQMAADIPALGEQTAQAMKDMQALASAGFPMGWSDTTVQALAEARGWPLVRMVAGMILGWLFTASAAMLGAPFWFSLLGQIRGSSSAPVPAPAPGK